MTGREDDVRTQHLYSTAAPAWLDPGAAARFSEKNRRAHPPMEKFAQASNRLRAARD